MFENNFERIIMNKMPEHFCEADTELMHATVRDLVGFMKHKGLTIRQAQIALAIASEMLIDEKLI